MSKVRRLGDITQDLEPLLLEMAVDHDLQHGEILNIIRGYLEIHVPGQRECYVDGTQPVFFYGHEEDLNGRYKRRRKLKAKNS
jgi:hypothetical protein